MYFQVYDPIFLNDSPENLMSLCPDFRSHRINKIHKIFFHCPLLNIFWRTNNQSVKLWSRWDKIVRDASNKTSSILSDPCELLTKTHRKWKVFPNLHLIEYLEMNCQHLRSNNLLTPMGTVPISVIYGFEYHPMQTKVKQQLETILWQWQGFARDCQSCWCNGWQYQDEAEDQRLFDRDQEISQA